MHGVCWMGVVGVESNLLEQGGRPASGSSNSDTNG